MLNQANNQIILSICIPTYNRAGFLKETVESIVQQINEDNRAWVEVVIGDNSANNESEVAMKLIKTKNRVNINYHRNESNIGANRNILLLVERASGEFCWILGDDDLIVPGAIDKLLKQIRMNPEIDVFMGDKGDFYIQPSNNMKSRKILKLKQERIFNFKQQEIIKYFKVSKKLIGFFNFISVLIVKKDSWLKVKEKEKYIDTEYSHMYIVMSMLFSGGRGILKYLPEKIILRRWGTEPISDVVAKAISDVKSVHAIAEQVFDDPRCVRAMDNLILKGDGFSWAVRAKIVKEKIFYSRIFPFLFNYFWSYPLFWLKIVPLLFVPNFTLKIMRNFYRKMFKGEPLSAREILAG